MQGISLEFKGMESIVDECELEIMKEQVMEAHDKLNNKTGAGKELLGWLDLPNLISDEERAHIKACSDRIKKQSDVFIVIGIGGSYVGSKAVIDIFSHTFSNITTFGERKHPQIFYAGNNLSGKYLRDMLEYIADKDVSINVISKSGKTLEPSIAFRVLKLFLEQKYGVSGAAERIYVTTDQGQEGLLYTLAKKNEYEIFTIPEDVPGRYSVLTAVGLLPMAVANIDFEDILDGAIFAEYLYNENSFENNDCYLYAAYRNILNQKGKDIELMASYEPSFLGLLEWLKQLFAESEGKDGKGLFPASVNFTTDLHSFGQMIQDGKRNMFETVLTVKRGKSFITLPKVQDDFDELNYLAGVELDVINEKAFKGTLKAHTEGQVPCIAVNIEEVTEYNIGQLIYFYEKACAISGYVLGVNPFNQPGVESYKKNIKALLKEGV